MPSKTDIDHLHNAMSQRYELRQENLKSLLSRMPAIDVARSANVTPATISQVKNGHRQMSYELARKIERGMSLPAEWFDKYHLDLSELSIAGPRYDEPGAVIAMHGDCDQAALKEEMARKVRGAIQYSDYATALFTTSSLCIDEMLPTQRRYLMDWVTERYDLNGIPRGQSQKLEGPEGSDAYQTEGDQWQPSDADEPWNLAGGERRLGQKPDDGNRRRATDGERKFMKLFHDGGYSQ